MTKKIPTDRQKTNRRRPTIHVQVHSSSEMANSIPNRHSDQNTTNQQHQSILTKSTNIEPHRLEESSKQSIHQNSSKNMMSKVDHQTRTKLNKKQYRLVLLFAIPLCLIILASMVSAIYLALFFKSGSTTTVSSMKTTMTTTISSTTTSSTTTTTDIPCTPACSSNQTCIQGVCVGMGLLAYVITWSRSGDGDIIVMTPNNNKIYCRNTGPTSATDYGTFDFDDRTGRGPENVFWPYNVSAPPHGLYHVCMEPFHFTPNVSTNNPVETTLKVYYSATLMQTFQKTIIYGHQTNYTCGSSSPILIASFIYP